MQTPKSINRRKFIGQSALISFGFLALSRCSNSPSGKSSVPDLSLQPDPKKYMDLPEGFEYRIISRAGEKMDDGFLVPGRADGMGAFSGPDGKVIVVRNHENSPTPAEYGPFGSQQELLPEVDRQKLYDAGHTEMPSLGGTTTFIYNEATGKVEKQYLSLIGTNRNCAGGVTPWNTWLTCEEDVTTKGEKAEKDHGFVFEIPATDQIGLIDPIPITAMGRFNHEAVAVDPKTGIVYQTEDEGNGLIYRYIPDVRGQLHAGGRLQVLAILDQPSFDTRNWETPAMEIQKPMPVQWLDIDDVLNPAGDLRLRGFDQGAARFARGEGIWFGEDELYFACTNGGPGQHGQVFRYRTSPQEGQPEESENPGTLELFAESPDKTVLHMCDNLTIAPWGDVILCEDNGELNHIRGINREGKIYDLAVNRSSSSEFAGLVFSPSGKTLFVNIQESGETLAITGPWERLA
jgi:hypothetical protein